jgi:hypothetical protein
VTLEVDVALPRNTTKQGKDPLVMFPGTPKVDVDASSFLEQLTNAKLDMPQVGDVSLEDAVGGSSYMSTNSCHAAFLAGTSTTGVSIWLHMHMQSHAHSLLID